ncbi:hypothetical protein ACVIGA_008715, partial [Bradyrhizobium sp. USDA 3240]
MDENVADCIADIPSTGPGGSMMPARRAGLANTGRDPCSPLSSDHKNRFGQTWRKGGFFILRVLQGGHGPVAQLDRVADFYSAGC